MFNWFKGPRRLARRRPRCVSSRVARRSGQCARRQDEEPLSPLPVTSNQFPRLPCSALHRLEQLGDRSSMRSTKWQLVSAERLPCPVTRSAKSPPMNPSSSVSVNRRGLPTHSGCPHDGPGLLRRRAETDEGVGCETVQTKGRLPPALLIPGTSAPGLHAYLLYSALSASLREIRVLRVRYSASSRNR
jgi:hypothetical protein